MGGLVSLSLEVSRVIIVGLCASHSGPEMEERKHYLMYFTGKHKVQCYTAYCDDFISQQNQLLCSHHYMFFTKGAPIQGLYL